MTSAHELISRLTQALNTRDTPGLLAIFSDEATIRDGGLRFRGTAGIQQWIQTTIARHALSLKVLGVSGHGPEWHLDAIVSGTFEGSPVRIEHSLTIEDGKIVRLEI